MTPCHAPTSKVDSRFDWHRHRRSRRDDRTRHDMRPRQAPRKAKVKSVVVVSSTLPFQPSRKSNKERHRQPRRSSPRPHRHRHVQPMKVVSLRAIWHKIVLLPAAAKSAMRLVRSSTILLFNTKIRSSSAYSRKKNCVHLEKISFYIICIIRLMKLKLGLRKN